MSRITLVCLVLSLLLGTAIRGQKQERPKVFIVGTGNLSIASGSVGAAGLTGDSAIVGGSSGRSAVNHHDQTMEMATVMLDSCPGVEVTLDGKNRADYTVSLNREGQPTVFGELGKSQVMVLNARLTPIFVSKTQTVKNAVKQACNAVLSDWQAFGKLDLDGHVTSVSATNAVAEYDVALVVHPTARAVRYCKPETVSAISADFLEYFKVREYALGTSDKAEIILDVTIDRPISKWVELTVSAKTASGETLFSEKLSGGGSTDANGTAALRNTLDKAHKLMDQKLPHRPEVNLK
jgi:hypothetical protein